MRSVAGSYSWQQSISRCYYYVTGEQGIVRQCSRTSTMHTFCQIRTWYVKGKKLVFSIIFHLLEALLLALAFLGVSFILQKRRKNTPTEQRREGWRTVFSINCWWKNPVQRNHGINQSFWCYVKGGYGSVYKARLPSTSTVAVKKLHHLPNSEITYQKEFLNEL